MNNNISSEFTLIICHSWTNFGQILATLVQKLQERTFWDEFANSPNFTGEIFSPFKSPIKLMVWRIQNIENTTEGPQL